MKVLKRAEQKNFELATDMYTYVEIAELLNLHYIWYFDDNYKRIYKVDLFHWKEKNYRVFAEDIDEIHVVYNKEYGFYETVATMKDRETILHITL